MIKLIACDLDGTLLNNTHVLSAKSKEILPKLGRYGIQFMVATGRMRDSVIGLFQDMLPKGEYLLLNGALLCDGDGTIVYEKAMTKDCVRKVDRIFKKHMLSYHMFTSIGTVTTDEERSIAAFLAHLRGQGLAEDVVQQMKEESGFCKYAREVKDIEAFLEEPIKIYKMEAFGGEHEHLEKARHALRANADIALTNSIEDNIEITMYDAQKGIALRHYCEQKKIAPEEVIVIGDSRNDISMLQMFPNSIAMKNGSANVQGIAAYISRYTNDEDGVAYILEQLLTTLSIQEK